ncbi:MAG: hypothetical protein ABL984_02760 [Pyrinomonadaceae bacterium]
MRLVLSFALTTALLGLAGLNCFAQADRRVTIESYGWKLIGDLRMPKVKGPVPVVLMFNKANGSRDAYKPLAGYLSDRDIASFRIDLRGHGESTNKGKFGPPFDAPMLALTEESDRDVYAAVAYVKGLKGIDIARIGIVGASYSGEEMAIAARKMGYAKAYVALSPGSYSEQSINAIDTSGARWLFVRSADERNLKGMHEEIRKISKTAELFEVAGSKHASDLLDATPGLPEMIAAWFKHNL